MRISALIDRLWGDIAAQPIAVALLAAAVVWIAFLAACGLVVLARRVERRLRARRERTQLRRRARLARRDPGRALAALDDRAIWREAAAQGRPRCAPRRPDAFEVHRAISLATQYCRDAAARKDAA